MFNVEASIYNSSLLGSGGALKYVRMASSVSCQAAATASVLTVGAPRFQMEGYAFAQSNISLYKARRLSSAASGQSVSGVSLGSRRLYRLNSNSYAESSSTSSLRNLHPNLFSDNGSAVASGDALVAAKRMLSGDFDATASGELKFTPRRYRRLSGDFFCFTNTNSRVHKAQKLLAAGAAQTYAHAVLRVGQKLVSSPSYTLASSTTSLSKHVLVRTVFSGSASATSPYSEIAKVNNDIVSERTMVIGSESRLMIVAGAR